MEDRSSSILRMPSEPQALEAVAPVAKLETGIAQGVSRYPNLMWRPWKMVSVGPDHAIREAEIVEILETKGVYVSGLARDLLKQVDFRLANLANASIGIVLVSVKELHFYEPASTIEIYQRAFDLGLIEIPASAVPRLRLDYLDQPKGEWIVVGMRPIVDSVRSCPSTFHIGYNMSGKTLAAGSARPTDVWPLDQSWIFQIPEQNLLIESAEDRIAA